MCFLSLLRRVRLPRNAQNAADIPESGQAHGFAMTSDRRSDGWLRTCDGMKIGAVMCAKGEHVA